MKDVADDYCRALASGDEVALDLVGAELDGWIDDASPQPKAWHAPRPCRRTTPSSATGRPNPWREKWWKRRTS
jgi:hypothetical protein